MTALVYCPFPDAETAQRIGGQLIDEGLIACINIGSSITSLFAWDGERGSAEETPALLKTDAALLEQAIARLEALHPYESPPILGWRWQAGGATRSWLGGLATGGRNAGK